MPAARRRLGRNSSAGGGDPAINQPLGLSRRRARRKTAEHPGVPAGPRAAAAGRREGCAKSTVQRAALQPDGRAYRIEDGIPVLLVDEAVTVTDDAEHQRLLDRRNRQTPVARFPDGFLWGVATAAHQVEGNNVANDAWLMEQLPGSHLPGAQRRRGGLLSPLSRRHRGDRSPGPERISVWRRVGAGGAGNGSDLRRRTRPLLAGGGHLPASRHRAGGDAAPLHQSAVAHPAQRRVARSRYGSPIRRLCRRGDDSGSGIGCRGCARSTRPTRRCCWQAAACYRIQDGQDGCVDGIGGQGLRAWKRTSSVRSFRRASDDKAVAVVGQAHRMAVGQPCTPSDRGTGGRDTVRCSKFMAEPGGEEAGGCVSTSSSTAAFCVSWVRSVTSSVCRRTPDIVFDKDGAEAPGRGRCPTTGWSWCLVPWRRHAVRRNGSAGLPVLVTEHGVDFDDANDGSARCVDRGRAAAAGAGDRRRCRRARLPALVADRQLRVVQRLSRPLRTVGQRPRPGSGAGSGRARSATGRSPAPTAYRPRQARQVAGEVALQVRRDRLGDLLDRQRLERVQLQDVAGHHHADQLRRHELHADAPAAGRIVDARADLRGDDFLQEGPNQR